MPDVDLSPAVPVEARWVKVHYEMKSTTPNAQLIARLWSGVLDDAVVIKGDSGDAFIELKKPQTLSYQRPVTVELTVKVLAYKI